MARFLVAALVVALLLLPSALSSGGASQRHATGAYAASRASAEGCEEPNPFPVAHRTVCFELEGDESRVMLTSRDAQGLAPAYLYQLLDASGSWNNVVGDSCGTSYTIGGASPRREGSSIVIPYVPPGSAQLMVSIFDGPVHRWHNPREGWDADFGCAPGVSLAGTITAVFDLDSVS